jgi:hypothetical protein
VHDFEPGSLRDADLLEVVLVHERKSFHVQLLILKLNQIPERKTALL